MGATRVVDYVFKFSKDDVGPRFAALDRAQLGFKRNGKRVWGDYERNAVRSLSNVSRHGKKKFDQLGRDARAAIGSKLAGALGAAALGVAVKKSITNLANFGDEMTALAIKVEQPIESLNGIKREIESFSLESGVEASAEDIASGVNVLAGAGFNLADSFAITKVAAKGASIAQAGMGTIISGLSDIMLGFKIPAEQAEQVLSKMIKAGDLGKVELKDLSGAMGDVIPAAKKMGASLDEVLGFLATLSVSGVSNVNEVSTSVGRLFERFARSDFLEQAKEFGIQVADDKGNLKSPLVIMNLILRKLDELEGQAKKNKFLEELVPEIRADRALTPLLDKTSELRKSIEAVGIASGRFSEAFTENLKRLNVKFSRFQNIVSFMSRDFATLFEPGIDMFSAFIGANFDPTKGGQTLSDQIREMIKIAAEEAEKGKLGELLWKKVLIDPLRFTAKNLPRILLDEFVNGLKNKFLGRSPLFPGQGLLTELILSNEAFTAKPKGPPTANVFIGGGRVSLPLRKAGEASILEQIRGRLIANAAQSNFRELQRESKLLKVGPILIQNQIDSTTGKTKTDVTLPKQVDLQRRLPIGATP